MSIEHLLGARSVLGYRETSVNKENKLSALMKLVGRNNPLENYHKMCQVVISTTRQK